MEPVIYLPIEMKHREMPSRAFLAKYLLQAGYTVVVGQQWSMWDNVDTLPCGLILFKTVNDIQAHNMARFRGSGHLVAASDEEALNFIEFTGHTLAFNECAADNCDLFLAQNESHKHDVESKFPQLSGKIEVAGNLRTDLLVRPSGHIEDQAKKFKSRYGPYLLFNTNYASANHKWKDFEEMAAVAAACGLFDRTNRKSTEGFVEMYLWEQRNCDVLVKLLRWTVEKFPEYSIIVRPHPSEHSEFWRRLLSGTTRAHVVEQSDPHPWILGSKLTIHTGCTTGLEAAILDIPVINLLPSDHPTCDRIVTYINPTFQKWEAAAQYMEAFLRLGEGPTTEERDKYRSALSKHLPGFRDTKVSQLTGNFLIRLLENLNVEPNTSYVFKLRGARLTPATRGHMYKEKMTASSEEMLAELKYASSVTGLGGELTINVLDDSLFLLQPN
jgi:surface carbohydrate biosynthesis protein